MDSYIPSIGGLFNQQQYIPGTNIPAAMAGTGAVSYVPGNPSGAPMDINQFLAAHAGENQVAAKWQAYNAGNGWMSPEELRAQTRSLGGMTSGQSSGGSSGGGGAMVQRQSSGGGISPGLLGNVQQATPGQLNTSISYPNTQPVQYGSPSPIAGATGMPQAGLSPQGGVLQMQQANPQSGLEAYKNTTGYQLLNAPGAFQQSPGYQFAVDQAINQSQGNAAARGLLESGSALRGMNNAIQGVANQEYGNWWNRQNQLYGDYQNRLAGLAGGNVGADMANQLGQNLAAGTMQTGGNIGGLLGNQGAAGYGGLVNTGAAQSNNMTNAGAQQAQINAANQSTQLAGAVYNRGLF